MRESFSLCSLEETFLNAVARQIEHHEKRDDSVIQQKFISSNIDLKGSSVEGPSAKD